MTVIKINKIEAEVNNILNNSGIMGMIQYVNTLSNDEILNNIPEAPQFIVKYLQSDEQRKKNLEINTKNYQDMVE